MQYGLFMAPMPLPEKPLAQAFDEDIDLLIRLDMREHCREFILVVGAMRRGGGRARGPGHTSLDPAGGRAGTGREP
jgi:hypothetical protein